MTSVTLCSDVRVWILFGKSLRCKISSWLSFVMTDKISSCGPQNGLCKILKERSHGIFLSSNADIRWTLLCRIDLLPHQLDKCRKIIFGWSETDCGHFIRYPFTSSSIQWKWKTVRLKNKGVHFEVVIEYKHRWCNNNGNKEMQFI